MTARPIDSPHHDAHAQAAAWQPLEHDLIRVGSATRRWFLQAGLGGLAGLSTAGLLQMQAGVGGGAGQGCFADRKSVILFWLSGGPSHLDMWDPKPDAPAEVRGPFGSIADAACRASGSASTCRGRRRSWTS